MNIILVLIPVTFLIVSAAVGVFFWAVHHQQFDDLESPGVLPLMEENEHATPAPPRDETNADDPQLRRRP